MLTAAAAGMLFAAATAGAQQYPLRLPAGTAAQPQRGTSPPPRVETPDPQFPANPLYPPYPLGFTYIPAILMSDGTVWANFGHGYVRIHSACVREPRVIDGRGTSTSRRRETRDGYCYTRTSQGSLVVTR